MRLSIKMLMLFALLSVGIVTMYASRDDSFENEEAPRQEQVAASEQDMVDTSVDENENQPPQTWKQKANAWLQKNSKKLVGASVATAVGGLFVIAFVSSAFSSRKQRPKDIKDDEGSLVVSEGKVLAYALKASSDRLNTGALPSVCKFVGKKPVYLFSLVTQHHGKATGEYVRRCIDGNVQAALAQMNDEESVGEMFASAFEATDEELWKEAKIRDKPAYEALSSDEQQALLTAKTEMYGPLPTELGSEFVWRDSSTAEFVGLFFGTSGAMYAVSLGQSGGVIASHQHNYAPFDSRKVDPHGMVTLMADKMLFESRQFGNLGLQPHVSANPTVTPIDGDKDFYVLASGELFRAMTAAEILAFVKEKRTAGVSLSAIEDLLVSEAKAKAAAKFLHPPMGDIGIIIVQPQEANQKA